MGLWHLEDGDKGQNRGKKTVFSPLLQRYKDSSLDVPYPSQVSLPWPPVTELFESMASSYHIDEEIFKSWLNLEIRD